MIFWGLNHFNGGLTYHFPTEGEKKTRTKKKNKVEEMFVDFRIF